MKRIVIFLIVLFAFHVFAEAYTIERNPNETKEQFIERTKIHNSTVAGKIIDAEWNNSQVLTVFFLQMNDNNKLDKKNNDCDERLIVCIYVQKSPNYYNSYFIDTISCEGDSPMLKDAFFANADGDLDKELVLIIAWNQKHYDFSGVLYGSFVYDYYQENGNYRFSDLKDIADKISGGCECVWKDGSENKSLFKTANEIKEQLNKLGFKQ